MRHSRPIEQHTKHQSWPLRSSSSMEIHANSLWNRSIKFIGPSKHSIWISRLRARKESYNWINLNNLGFTHMRIPSYTRTTKKWHDKRIIRKEFNEWEFVMLFNSMLRLFLRKLRSRWSRLFHVKKVMSSCAVEVWSKSTRSFIVNGQRLKNYVTCE